MDRTETILHPSPDGPVLATSDSGAQLAEKVPLSARVVVHLGCGGGALGVALRRRHPAVRLIGIEADPGQAARASEVFDQVYCLAAEPGPLPRLAAADCIVVAPGILEGLSEPVVVLGELAGALAPGGMLLVALSGADLDSQHRMLAAAGLLVLDAGEVQSGATRHICWRLGLARREQLHIVSTMLPPVGGVSQVRVLEPMEALGAEAGITTAIASRLDMVPHLEGEAGIFILHRPALLGSDGLKQLRELMARGWVVVCEFDDFPAQIPILYRSDVHNFRAVHAIQTSTPALAEVLGRENPEIAVFPNAIRALPEVVNFADPGQVTLLFAALNREEDWPGHVEALNAAAADAGGALRFHVIADQAFFDALATPHKAFTPLCDYETYLGILSRCEVSFMPLRDTLFNRCKSDLKYLEAAAHRAVALASPTVYGGSIRDGVNGLLFDGPQGLYDRLMQVVADPDGARAMAERARTDIAGHRMLAYQMPARVKWYRDLWARRAELHQALLRRVPELG
jgi:SAM-dependent methyltransferase